MVLLKLGDFLESMMFYDVFVRKKRLPLDKLFLSLKQFSSLPLTINQNSIDAQKDVLVCLLPCLETVKALPLFSTRC